MADPRGWLGCKHSLQLFGCAKPIDDADGTSILSVQDGKPAVVLCAAELPEHQARVAAQLIQAHTLAQQAWYNRTNAVHLLAVAVQIHSAILLDRC